MKKQRIAVGLSGGVDSSLTAKLLMDRGYEVVAVTLLVHPEVSAAPAGENHAVSRAREVAAQFGIEHHVVSCADAFSKEVLFRCYEDFVNARTPNPCVYCNRHVKFGWLMDFAERELNAPLVATGHYVQMKEWEGVTRLFRGADASKDQSYFLFALTDAQRARIKTPLGSFLKTEVRKLAAEYGIASARDKDSQDICFDIYGEPYTNYLGSRFGFSEQPGFFVDESGKKIAPHTGLHRYTIGQRKGLGVALGKPAFIKEIHSGGDIVLTTEHDHLKCEQMKIRNLVWHGTRPSEKIRCTVSTRYRQHPLACTLTVEEDGNALVKFDTPLAAVTPGQCAVFYRDDLVLGGGWIRACSHNRSIPIF